MPHINLQCPPKDILSLYRQGFPCNERFIGRIKGVFINFDLKYQYRLYPGILILSNVVV